MRRFATLVLGAGALALAACSGGEETANQPAGQAGTNSMANDPSNPFGAIEMQMNERMMAATGANPSETWARKMIEHHRGAIQMSQLLIDRGGEPGFVQMARGTVTKQQREIGELERALAGALTGRSGEANPFASIEKSMHDQMMAATGANLSQAWARKMIAHHQGAVDMSEALIRQGGDAEALAMARRIATDQRAEIAHLEAMLRGEPMPKAGASAAAPSTAAAKQAATSSAKPEPRRTSASSPAPAASAEQPKKAAPAAQPTTQPKPDCAPEHRAAGHC